MQIECGFCIEGYPCEAGVAGSTRLCTDLETPLVALSGLVGRAVWHRLHIDFDTTEAACALGLILVFGVCLAGSAVGAARP